MDHPIPASLTKKLAVKENVRKVNSRLKTAGLVDGPVLSNASA